MYTQKIMQHFLHPQNAGSLKKPDIIGKAVDEENGEVIKIYLRINPSSYVCEDVAFKTLGSPFAIASTDLVCNMLRDKSIDDIVLITRQEIMSYIGSENIPFEKKYSISTIEQTILKIIKIFNKKYFN